MTISEETRLKKRTAHKESETIYKGSLFNVRKENLAYDEQKHSYEIVDHPGAAVIIPVTQEGDFLLVRQYRYPVDEIFLEFPAGVIDKGESPEETATRELREETGFKSQKLTFLHSMWVAPGYCTEKLYVYEAKELEAAPLYAEDTDQIDLETLSQEKLFQRARGGDIQDMKTLASLFLYRER